MAEKEICYVLDCENEVKENCTCCDIPVCEEHGSMESGNWICDDCSEKKECEICEEKSDTTYECERCYKSVCLDCVSSDYPYSVTLCSECFDEWENLMQNNNFTY